MFKLSNDPLSKVTNLDDLSPKVKKDALLFWAEGRNPKLENCFYNNQYFFTCGQGDSSLTIERETEFKSRLYAWLTLKVGKYEAKMITYEKQVEFGSHLGLEIIGGLSHNIVAQIDLTKLQGHPASTMVILNLVHDAYRDNIIPKMSYRRLLEKYSQPQLPGMPEETLYSILGSFLVSTRNALMSRISRKHQSFFRYLLQFHEKNINPKKVIPEKVRKENKGVGSGKKDFKPSVSGGRKYNLRTKV